MSIYWKVSPDGATPQYYVNDLKLLVNDPTKDSDIDFQIDCKNFTQISFQENYTKVNEYQNANSPDLMLISSLLKDQTIYAWSKIWNNAIMLYDLSLPCNSFLKQTGFNTYESVYRFDDGKNTVSVGNGTFAIANVTKVSFEVTMPKNYRIQNIDNSTFEEQENAFLVKSVLRSGQTFQLRVTDLNQETTRTVLSYISYLGFAGIAISLAVYVVARRHKH